jgi:hypothetical protein
MTVKLQEDTIFQESENNTLRKRLGPKKEDVGLCGVTTRNFVIYPGTQYSSP